MVIYQSIYFGIHSVNPALIHILIDFLSGGYIIATQTASALLRRKMEE